MKSHHPNHCTGTRQPAVALQCQRGNDTTLSFITGLEIVPGSTAPELDASPSVLSRLLINAMKYTHVHIGYYLCASERCMLCFPDYHAAVSLSLEMENYPERYN